MVEIVLGVAVFVLAVAVTGLFAMMGELAGRAGDPDQRSGLDRLLQTVPEAKLGAAPAEWPAELAAVRDADRAYVVVFGSTCATCGRIASGATGPLSLLPPPLAIVVACPGPEAGADFVAKYPLVAEYPYLLDVNGAWLVSNFEVGMSPGVLVFSRGRLESANTFTAATALRQMSTPDNQKGLHVGAAKATG
jgi:hypothetical protein